MVRTGFTASEEKSFENVDGRTYYGQRMCAYAISSHMKAQVANNIHDLYASY